jgi:hypothetical protein
MWTRLSRGGSSDGRALRFVAWRRGDSYIVPQDASPIELERGNMTCMALARLVRRLDNDFMESFRQAPRSVGAQDKAWCELWALQVSVFRARHTSSRCSEKKNGYLCLCRQDHRGGVRVSLDELHIPSPERLVCGNCLQVPIRSAFPHDQVMLMCF